MHHSYMIVISVVFALVFAIMIYSMIRHSKAFDESTQKFTGTTGTMQWLWALVPLAVLGLINFSLYGVADDHISTNSKKIELAAAQNLPAVFQALTDLTPKADSERVVDTSGASSQKASLR